MQKAQYWFKYQGDGYGPYETKKEAKLDAREVMKKDKKNHHFLGPKAHIFHGTVVANDNKELLESNLTLVEILKQEQVE